MKIATFNVNGVNGRLARILEWLAETTPDIVCLQEIKTTDPKCPVLALERAGYRSIWHGQRSHHGVAILARNGGAGIGKESEAVRDNAAGAIPAKRIGPIEIRRGLPGDAEDLQARYLEAEVRGLRIASIYLPNGNPQPGPKFDYKLAWFERLIVHAQALLDTGRPVVLAGDFNVVPTNADIYNAWAWRFDAVMQPQTRAAYTRLLSQGWIDATRHLHPHEKIYTFWINASYFQRNAGFRMDFLLLSPDLAARLEASGVDAEFRGRDGASDHAPVWVQLRD